MPDSRCVGQHQVQQWFDAVYATKGTQYLRPPEAYPIFLQLLDAQPGQRLLDIACGPGLLLRAARQQGLDAAGIDISSVAVNLAPAIAPGASALVANAEALPFPNHAFDAVTCLGSIERFLDRRKALLEMRRVARPTARFCFMVRNAQSVGWHLLHRFGRINHSGHQDAGSLEGWSALLQQCGFSIDRVLPDQWWWQKWRHFLTRKIPRPEPVVSGIAPLRFANEFIFLCR